MAASPTIPDGKAGTGAAPPVAAPPKSGTGARPSAPATRGHWVANNNGGWELIHAVGPGKWVAGGVAGAAAPPKPKGDAPPPNNPMEPWGNNLVQQQAQKEIQGIYAPEQQGLDQQRQTAQNIYQKQQTDNEYYTQWATSQAAQNQTHQDQVNQSTNTVLGGLSNPNQLNAGTALQGEAAQGSLLANTLNTQAANNQALENEGITAATQNEQTGNTMSQNSATTYANDAIQAGAQKQLGTYNTALNTYNNDTAKLNTTEAGALQKEIVRLQGVQTSKAEYQESNAEAAEKLGLTSAVDQATINKDSADASATTLNSQSTARNALTNANKAATTAGLDTAEENRDNAAAQASIAEAAKYRSQTGANGVPTLTLAQATKSYTNITAVQGAVTRAIQAGYNANGVKLTTNQVYQAIKNGEPIYYYHAGATGHNLLTAQQTKGLITGAAVNPQTLLNAGYNVATVGHITQADLAALNKSGLFGVRSRYSVGPNPTPPKTTQRIVPGATGFAGGH